MGDEENRLTAYLPWARHFAWSCTSRLPAHVDREDLQSAGVLGYLQAAPRYDASRGASFRGYCAVRIRGAVLDEIRRWDWAPRSVHQYHRRVTHVSAELTEKLEREPTSSEIADALGMGIDELATWQARAQPRKLVSLEEFVDDGDDTFTLKERLPDFAAARPDAGMLSAEDRRLVLRCLACLPKTESVVIVLHYLNHLPLRDVARLLGVTPSRVSQLHHRALQRMRQAWSRCHSTALAGARTRHVPTDDDAPTS